MKKNMLFFLALLFSYTGIAQTSTEQIESKKWSIASHLVSQPYVFSTKNGNPNLFTGVGVTRYFGLIGIRFNYSQYDNNKSDSYYTDSGEYLNSSSLLKEHVFKLGIEYKKDYLDQLYLRLFLDYAFIPYSTEYNLNRKGSTLLHAEATGICNGAIAGIGIGWKFTEHFSVSGETRLDFLFSQQNQKVQNFETNSKVQYQVKGNTMNLRLIGNLSLNYHF